MEFPRAALPHPDLALLRPGGLRGRSASALRGSITTALWSIALTLPNVLSSTTASIGVGILWQHGDPAAIVAVFVGERVDRERLARAQPEARERARARPRSAIAPSSTAPPTPFSWSTMHLGSRPRTRRPPGCSASASRRSVGQYARATCLAPRSARRSPSDRPSRRPPLRRPRRGPPPLAGRAGIARHVVEHEGRRHAAGDAPRRHPRSRSGSRTSSSSPAARHGTRGGATAHRPRASRWRCPVARARSDARSTPSQTHRAPRAPAAAGEARGDRRRTAAELRRLSRALRPSILDDLGLIPALRSESRPRSHAGPASTCRFSVLDSPSAALLDLERIA